MIKYTITNAVIANAGVEMRDENKTKEQLIEELKKLRKTVWDQIREREKCS